MRRLFALGVDGADPSIAQPAHHATLMPLPALPAAQPSSRWRASARPAARSWLPAQVGTAGWGVVGVLELPLRACMPRHRAATPGRCMVTNMPARPCSLPLQRHPRGGTRGSGRAARGSGTQTSCTPATRGGGRRVLMWVLGGCLPWRKAPWQPYLLSPLPCKLASPPALRRGATRRAAAKASGWGRRPRLSASGSSRAAARLAEAGGAWRAGHGRVVRPHGDASKKRALRSEDRDVTVPM